MEDDERHDDADKRAVTKEIDRVSRARQAGRLEVHGAAFVVLSGADVGRSIPLDADEMTIGLQAVNEAHGREAGTEVLRQVAASMQGRIRAEDLLVRWRGDEFAILVRGIPPKGAFVLAERVRRGIEGLTVKHEANDIRVTMTIGAATVEGSPDLTGAGLVEAAEGLLREAKAGGPNRTFARLVVVGPAEAEARKDRAAEV